MTNLVEVCDVSLDKSFIFVELVAKYIPRIFSLNFVRNIDKTELKYK